MNTDGNASAGPAGGRREAPGPAAQRDRTLGQWASLVVRRWPVVVVFVLIGLTLGAAYTLTQPTLYEAQSTLVLSPQSGVLDPGSSENLPALASTISKLAVTDAVLLDARQRFIDEATDAAARAEREAHDLDWMKSHIASSVIANTSLVGITGRDGSPEDADELTAAASASVIAKVDGLRQTEGTRSGLVLATLGEPTAQGQVSPNLTRNLLLGGNLGLVLGILAAVLLADRGLRIRGRTELAGALGVDDVVGLPAAAHSRNGAPHGVGGLVVRPDDPGQEPYRILRSRLVAAADRGATTIALLGSVDPADLRDTASTLGAHLCAAGASTVIVEADFHGGPWHVGSPHGGLGDALTSGADGRVLELPVSIQRLDTGASVPAPVQLAVLTTGTPPPDPAAALVSPRAAELLERLAARYRHVIVAGPSASWQAESITLSERSDATLLVLGAGLSVEQARDVKASYEAEPGRLLAVAVIEGRRS
jgi:capsular polysaccharide biosynthesis protein